MATESTVQIARAYGPHVVEYAEINADRSFAEPLLDRFVATLDRGNVVADLGCGPGWETAAIERRGFRAIGLDATFEFLQYARGEHHASGYAAGDFLALPFANASLGGVWACSSLVHIEWSRIDAALREITRALTPGGVFFASMQAGATEGPLPSTTFPEKRFHYAYYKPAEWRRRLEAAGLDVVWENYDASEYCNPGAYGWIETLARRQ